MNKKTRIIPKKYLSGGSREKTYFAEDLSMLISAGVSISSALDVLAVGAKSKNYQKLLYALRDMIEDGSNLWLALSETNILPPNMINLIKIGEKSGRLDENLKIVSRQLQKERSFVSKVRSALLYPIIVLVTCVVVGLSVAWFILPKLANVFTNMGTEIPLPTRILIGMGDFIGQYGIILIPSVFGLIFASVILFSSVKFFSDLGHNFLFRLPMIRKLMIEVEVSRIGFVVGSLLDGGFSLLDAYELLSVTTRNFSFKKAFIETKSLIEDGMPLSKAISKSKIAVKLMPIQVLQMIMAGEQSGSLPAIMLKINEIYEERVDNSAKNLSVILEPLLLVVVWLAVLFIAVSVIMPIYGLIGGLS